VAKKRSRRTVKHQRGVVGASLDAIAARRNQKPEVRAAAQASALAKSKEEKKKRAEERKTQKSKVSCSAWRQPPCWALFAESHLAHPRRSLDYPGCRRPRRRRPQDFAPAGKGRQLQAARVKSGR
jgi:hypothetical protein